MLVVCYSVKPAVVCPICGHGRILPKKQYEMIKESIKNKLYTKDDYDKINLVGKTDVQVNYLKETRRLKKGSKDIY